MKKILVPHDFSKSAENALRFAAFYCDDRPDYEITNLYVSPKKLSTAEEESITNRLGEESKKVKTQSKIFSMVDSGKLNDRIISVQKSQEFDLIVMGTGGSDDVEEMAATNTSKLVLDVDAPLIVIPDKFSNFSIKNIALALDKNEIDDSLSLDILHSTARYFNAKVHILTITPEDGVHSQSDSNESILEYYLETIDYQFSFPRNTNIEEGINNYIEEKGIDLLAILPRNHAKKTEPSAGRLTKLLTLRARIPILTID